jgi:hypothetical protein
MLAQVLVADLSRPLELGQDEAEITLVAPDDAEGRRRVEAIAADPRENLVLRLRDVEADEEPGVSWEVYVASSDETDRDNVPALAGILSLYGAPPDAEFVVPLDAALLAGEPVGLRIIFRPTSGLVVDGEAVPPTVRTEVRIGGIGLETERAAGGSDSSPPNAAR